MKARYGQKIYGKYGFIDAFNPGTGWVDSDVIGINAGIILLSAENARSGNIWSWFMRNPELPRAMRLAGLRYQKQRHLPVQRKPQHSRELLGPRASRPQLSAKREQESLHTSNFTS
jgi:hypothetical protein